MPICNHWEFVDMSDDGCAMSVTMITERDIFYLVSIKFCNFIWCNLHDFI